MAVLRPGIRKVKIDAVHFLRSKNIGKQPGIQPQKADIPECLPCFGKCVHLLERSQEHTVVHLNAHVGNFGMSSGHFHQKTALSHADFDMDRSVRSEKAPPASLQLLRLLDHPAAARDGVPGSGYVFQSQISSPCKIIFRTVSKVIPYLRAG